MDLYYYNSGNIFIVLTDKRFIKIEDKKIVSESYLENIQYINHISGGWFRFDKIEIIEKNKKIEIFGIYFKEICLRFIKLLKDIIKMQ